MFELGVKQVADQLHEALLRYIETYHVRDVDVIEERRALLRSPGTIGQEPYIETTPAYELAREYAALDLPAPIGETLQELARWGDVGIFPRPYVHQAQALDAFFNEHRDLVVATGTGSGKTETFLMPILGQMLYEGAHRRLSWAHRGVRAIVLYPMNALVSDQLTRLRRLFGGERVAALFRDRYGRHPQFGMYTSRTPYPGVRRSDKDAHRVAPMLKYYLELEHRALHAATAKDRENAATLMRELKKRGRWPAKDIAAFFGDAGSKWMSRLVTDSRDRELFTRREMQQSAPDILVTNYSMLEYMLLRPIERNIFRQTKAWLEADPANELILVLDEAHMYRGVGGAEVALLIRRLQARLGIPRERLRCILTSASMGEGEAAQAAAHRFGTGLTGAHTGGGSPFALVRGTKADRLGDGPGDADLARRLGTLDLDAFFRRAEDAVGARDAVAQLAGEVGWPEPPSLTPDADDAALRRYLYQQLSGVGPMNRLVNVTAGSAKAFTDLTQRLFPGVPSAEAERATNVLVALGTYANDGGRPLMPARAHLFFRGLPSLYACIDPHCTERRAVRVPGERHLLGRLYTEPRTHCDCASRARVYEVYAHRDCGAVFLRVFGRGGAPDFYWHEQGGAIEPLGAPLDESFLILEEPHEKMTAADKARVEPVWIEITTGRVFTMPPAADGADRKFRMCWRARAGAATSLLRNKKTEKQKGAAKGNGGESAGPEAGNGRRGPFVSCPNCTRETGYKIMDLATKGEQPFANLVREQLMLQPAVREVDEQYPNGGRKVLLFSDGRQKAARLARDLPREVEFDTFRQALAIAVTRLERAARRVTLDDTLYRAFVTVCHDHYLHFFDQEENSQKVLLDHIASYHADHWDRQDEEAGLLALLEDGAITPPPRYRQALLRQLADPFYSIYAACVAVVEPSDEALRLLRRRLAQATPALPDRFVNDELRAFSIAWIQEVLDKGAFDPAVPDAARFQVNKYYKPVETGARFPRPENVLESHGGLSMPQVEFVRTQLYGVLTSQDASGNAHLTPGRLRLRVALDQPWHQCRSCGLTQAMPLYGRCADCDSTKLEQLAPDAPYMVARNGYIREPLRAVLSSGHPSHLVAEEHTAQLSQRDQGAVYATTEEYELRFQDVLADAAKPPVDVLSCTTTMEVGIDIGSLAAVGLRNVPPQRENYQQRAGRSGRRGSAVSTVITYAQDGPHDFFYYSQPAAIISGAPREPKIKIDNPRLAARHVNSYLIQTFFHATLDDLGQVVEGQIASERAHIMSALGDARDFFSVSGSFSMEAFREWATANVGAPSAPGVDAIAAWIPDDVGSAVKTLTQGNLTDAKRDFVVRTAAEFVAQLDALAHEFRSAAAASTTSGVDDDTDDSSLLLNVLFDRGLLPRYAFPTELASFYVFDSDGGIKEKPQQGKDKALSEYAPGRQLVIDKKTYRVGGIYTDDPRVLNPGEALFAQTLPVYVYCPRCTYVEVRPQRGAKPRVCPVCTTGLEECEMVDPPAFSPERGLPLRETDLGQEPSFATDAQFPSIVRPADLAWTAGPGPHLAFAYQENQELVVANKGPKQEGFKVCQICGAAWPTKSAPSDRKHARPYLLTKIHRRAGITRDCSGPLAPDPIYLGHKFRTDIVLVQMALHRPMAYSPADPWLHDALRTTAEALTLAASRRMDIDPGELAAGYRLMPPTTRTPGAQAVVDLYLYDTAAGGAGYAAEAGERLHEILTEALSLVRGCPEGCERSCTKCLRHYGNRMSHPRLDRSLAAQVIAYALDGRMPAVLDVAAQSESLLGLARYLELEGWTVCRPTRATEPLRVSLGGPEILVGTRPALLEESAARESHPVVESARAAGRRSVLLNDYVLSRDLPAAYLQLRRAMSN